MRIVIINVPTTPQRINLMSTALNASRTLSLPTGSPTAIGHSPLASCVYSTDLLRGQKAVEIVHNGSTYRLQATRLGKLILTK